MKSDFEERQEFRKERYQELARKNGRLAMAKNNQARAILEVTNGQPILVDHYSAPRHRRHLERADNAMRGSIEATEKSKYYTDKAASVGTGGISSDDPEAIVKVKEKLAQREAKQERMKAANKLVKKNDREGLKKLGYSEARIEELFKKDFTGQLGYPDYQIRNNGAEIRRLKKRLEELTRAEEREYKKHEFSGGFSIIEDPDENRVFLKFSGKPGQKILDVAGLHGFRWVPTMGVWSRHLNAAGIYAANEVKTAWLKHLEMQDRLMALIPPDRPMAIIDLMRSIDSREHEYAKSALLFMGDSRRGKDAELILSRDNRGAWAMTDEEKKLLPQDKTGYYCVVSRRQDG